MMINNANIAEILKKYQTNLKDAFCICKRLTKTGKNRREGNCDCAYCGKIDRIMDVKKMWDEKKSKEAMEELHRQVTRAIKDYQEWDWEVLEEIKQPIERYGLITKHIEKIREAVNTAWNTVTLSETQQGD